MERHKTHALRLNAADLARCRNLLNVRLYALRAAILEQREASDRGPGEATAAEVHDLKDDAFAGELANLRGMASDQVQGELAAVRAALGRVSDGSYGRCEDCDGEIGRERLLAQPSAARCFRCQESAEKPRAR